MRCCSVSNCGTLSDPKTFSIDKKEAVFHSHPTMKKQFYIGLGISCLLFSSASARTWTSAEGDKTFSGDFKGFDKASGKVSVNRGGKEITFPLEVLAPADQEWVTAKAEELEKAKPKDLADQKIGSQLTSRVLSRLKGKRFARAEITKAPEYYILYFSASW